jgi:hypothetical protein
MQSLYEVVVLLKIWEKNQPRTQLHTEQEVIDELTTFSRDLRYWIADWHVQHTKGIYRFIWQFRRKMRI